jgi:hypothetical protein
MCLSNAKVQLRTSQIRAHAEHAQSLNRSSAATFVRRRAGWTANGLRFAIELEQLTHATDNLWSYARYGVDVTGRSSA